MKYHELMFRLLLVICGAAITTLNLVIAATLSGEEKKNLAAYSEELRKEVAAVGTEMERM